MIVFQDPAKQDSTAFIKTFLVDQDEKPIKPSQIVSLTWSLFDSSGAVVNGRDEIDVLNNNGGVVTEDGVFTLAIPEANHAFSDESNGYEDRVARVTLTWDGGTQKTEIENFHYQIQNLDNVP